VSHDIVIVVIIHSPVNTIETNARDIVQITPSSQAAINCTYINQPINRSIFLFVS